MDLEEHDCDTIKAYVADAGIGGEITLEQVRLKANSSVDSRDSPMSCGGSGKRL